jgi:ubiquitin C-terminal hydrolase
MEGNEESIDHEIASESWLRHLVRNDSMINDLFYGQFKSKLTCPDPNCKKVSITFDPFSLISLPIP